MPVSSTSSLLYTLTTGDYSWSMPREMFTPEPLEVVDPPRGITFQDDGPIPFLRAFDNLHVTEVHATLEDAYTESRYDSVLGDPKQYAGEFLDTDPDGMAGGVGWPMWPDLSTEITVGYNRVWPHHIRADVIRWAFGYSFI